MSPTPANNCQDTIIIKAFGDAFDALNGIFPKFGLFINGEKVAEQEVTAQRKNGDAPQEFTFNVDIDDDIDTLVLRLLNDKYENTGGTPKDNNLFFQSVEVNGVVLDNASTGWKRLDGNVWATGNYPVNYGIPADLPQDNGECCTDTLRIVASADAFDAANGIFPKFGVFVNGTQVATQEVTALRKDGNTQEFIIGGLALPDDLTKLDIRMLNDKYQNTGGVVKDNNIFFQTVELNGTELDKAATGWKRFDGNVWATGSYNISFNVPADALDCENLIVANTNALVDGLNSFAPQDGGQGFVQAPSQQVLADLAVAAA